MSLILKLVFVSCFPALSTLFIVLRLYDMCGLWAAVAASVVFFILGLELGKIVQKHSSLRSSGAPFMFWVLAWMSSLILAHSAGIAPAVLALGGLLGPFSLRLFMFLLKKYNLVNRLESHQTYAWLIFTSSAAVPASMSLTQLNNVMSSLPIIIYVVVFGWFGPEVIARVVPGKSPPALIVGGFLFIIISFYAILGTLDPALKYVTPDWVVVVFFSYLACYTMLVSRCVLEIFERPDGQKE